MRRFVEAYERIYLFGSEARGEAGLAREDELLVIVPDVCQQSAGRARLSIVSSVAWALVATRSFFAARRNLRASLPGTILREGKRVSAI
ncbi:MAG: hypothetical protein KatS3mg061_1238 [Dehalococcoidia bacterium]|nr:MAG: hypothetical protein KatS3mg061_1238 [Dehalococcoidia bacterium]